MYVLLGATSIDSLYSKGLFRLVSSVLIPVTEKIPFSLFMGMIVLLVIGGPAAWIFNAVRLVRAGNGAIAGLLWGPVRLLFLLPLVFVWFAVVWGAGYQRPPVEQRLSLSTDKPTDGEVQSLMEELLQVVLRDQPKAEADRDVARAVRAISDSMTDFVRESDGISMVRLPRRVKATPPGMLLFNSTSGICSPFTLEANVDGAIPDTGFVYVAAHELAHTAGINREGEATLYGQIAGLRSGDAYARYCVALDAYTDLARDLGKEGFSAAMERLPEASRAELKHIHEVSSSYNVKWFSQQSWKVYNKYLQSQGIKEGTKNYSASTKLLIFASRKGLIKDAGTSTTP